MPTDECTKVGQVSERCEKMESSIGYLHEAINLLYARLEPVLGPDSTCDKESDEKAAYVPLAARLDGYIGQVDGAAVRIRNLSRRLEL